MSIGNGANKFSDGLLCHFEPILKKLEKQLAELVARQESAIKELEAENSKLNNANTSELVEMFLTIKDYQIRLLNLKREMLQLSERSLRVKKKALKLQEFKQKEALENAHYREAQLKREQDLIVRTKSCPGPSSQP